MASEPLLLRWLLLLLERCWPCRGVGHAAATAVCAARRAALVSEPLLARWLLPLTQRWPCRRRCVHRSVCQAAKLTSEPLRWLLLLVQSKETARVAVKQRSHHSSRESARAATQSKKTARVAVKQRSYHSSREPARAATAAQCEAKSPVGPQLLVILAKQRARRSTAERLQELPQQLGLSPVGLQLPLSCW